MAMFGTLRRKGKKLSMDQELSFANTLSPDKATSPVFSSTPNLNKLTIEGIPGPEYDESPSRSDASEEYCFDHERNLYFKRSSSTKYKYLDRNRKGSYGSVPASLATAVTTLPAKSKSSSPSSLRNFVSMVSMASGLKRSKSIRKQAFASALHLRPSTEHDGVILEDSSASGMTKPTTSTSRRSSTRSLRMRGSRSAPSFESGLRRLVRDADNSEPGVASSSSSLSSSGSSCQSPAMGRGSSSSVGGRSSTRSQDSDYGTLGKLSSETIERTKLMLQGAKKFNMEPKKGIDFIVLNGLIERTPEQVAQFLKDGEGLSKSAIGNYLGEHHEFNLQVLQAFVDLHDFTNVSLVQALRQFLWSFRLPGEAQKIDRMMESFAKRYTQLNPDLFVNSDTCYLLSFAIIMLNTSLHNVNVKEKPTAEQFIRMNRDIDGGQALDREFIISLYSSILTEPFQIPPEDGNDLMLTFFNPEIEGWLWKQGGRYKNWQRRWFILSNNCIYYFLFTTDKNPRGIIPLENIVAKKSSEKLGKRFVFSLYKDPTEREVSSYIKSCKTADGKLSSGKHTSYHLATATKKERDNWIRAISQNNSSNDFYTFLAMKKSSLEAMGHGKGTLPRTRSSQSSPRTVRKSQISFPLTRPDPSKSELLHPNSTSRSNRFGSLDSGSSREYAVSYRSGAESDSDESQISIRVPKLTRRASEQEPGSSPSQPKLTERFRKSSLPSQAKLAPTDCLTSIGIRISVEDADAVTIVPESLLEVSVGNLCPEITVTDHTCALLESSEPTCNRTLESNEPTGSPTAENVSVYADLLPGSPDEVTLFQQEGKGLYVPNVNNHEQEDLETEIIETTEAVNKHVQYPIVFEACNENLQPSARIISCELKHGVTYEERTVTTENLVSTVEFKSAEAEGERLTVYSLPMSPWALGLMKELVLDPSCDKAEATLVAESNAEDSKVHGAIPIPGFHLSVQTELESEESRPTSQTKRRQRKPRPNNSPNRDDEKRNEIMVKHNHMTVDEVQCYDQIHQLGKCDTVHDSEHLAEAEGSLAKAEFLNRACGDGDEMAEIPTLNVTASPVKVLTPTVLRILQATDPVENDLKLVAERHTEV